SARRGAAKRNGRPLESGMASARTSESHPIQVGWLKTRWPGQIGLTFAPGKKQRSPASGAAWDRDLDRDLADLREKYGATHLVCLLEDAELRELEIEALPEA